MIRASWDRLSSPPPSRTDNAILPQVSAESYKKGGSLSQGFSLALPPAAWLASNGRGAPARLGKKLSRYPWRAGRGHTSIPFVGLDSNVAVRLGPGLGQDQDLPGA